MLAALSVKTATTLSWPTSLITSSIFSEIHSAVCTESRKKIFQHENTLPPILPPISLSPPSTRTRPSRPKYKENSEKTAWTAEEDNLLRLAVQLYGDRSERWTKIAACVPGRSNKMCRKRWFHSLDPTLRKGPWTEEEDKLLKRAVEKHQKVWCKVAESIPGRTDDQCAKRWKECLDPSIDHNEWTPQEDQLLLERYGEFGSKWQQIAKSFPGRPGLHCRNRWRKIQRLKKANKDNLLDMIIYTPNDITPKLEALRAFACGADGCNSHYSNPNGLYYHMKAAHPNLDSSKKPFRCALPGCSKKYKNINGLLYHIKEAKGTSGHQADNDDEESQDSAIKPYKCPVPGCKNSYRNANGLQYHQRHAHEKE
ncbi:10075_t:CDS:2 [Entrophospora sp. SA101]|nr:10075_t:CDS:2 [Entrophospora sp. SA101]